MLSIYPSIILLLFLCIKSVSASSLARYFAPKKLDRTEANIILKEYQYLWPSDVLNCKSLREHLETGENAKVILVLGKLNGSQLDEVLDVTLYPHCSDKMLDNFKLVTANFWEPCMAFAFAHIFIHQKWTVTKKLIGTHDDSLFTKLFVYAAGLLAFKAYKYKQFALIKTIYDAIAPKHLSVAVEATLSPILSMSMYDFTPLYTSFILNDPEKYFTVEIFRTLKDGTPKLAISSEKGLVMLDKTELFDHPLAESQNFAKAINLLLSDEDCPFSINDFMDMADTSDIPALRQYLAKNSQKKFLEHFGVWTIDNLDSAWSKVVLKRKDRHEEWYKKHATPILLQLQQLHVSLPHASYLIISEYAAT